MLSKTAQLAADRAVRSIARTYQDAPARDTPAMYAMEHAVWEAQNRGYHRNHDWMSHVEAAAIALIEARIQSTAPNAANAAPLMPICDACAGAGERPTMPWRRDGYDAPEECPTCDGTGRLRATREGFPDIIRPGHLGADESLPAYAWPGGYPLVYMPCDEHGDTSACVILCADCATHDLHLPDPDDGYTRFTSVIEDGDLESDTVCDGCNAVIAHQNYCSECRECVDTEDAPHLCPATEPYTVWYLPTVPSDEWKAFRYDPEGPERAKEIAHSLRAQGLAAFVHVQPARLDFPPVISEEEE